MTPPPPGRAAPSAPRARVLSLPAPFGLPLRLLLVFWVAAASAQGHSRSGPRISAVWKGRRRRAAGGARDRTLCGAGAECAAPGESACAQLCGSQAGPEGSVWVPVSVCECAYCHGGAGWSAAACERVAGARAQLSGAPSPTAALSPSRSAGAWGWGEGCGPLPHRGSLALRHGVYYTGPFFPLASFLTPTSSLRAAGSAGTRGSGSAGEGGADPLPPPLRSGCGNKDPAACPRPRPGPERGPGKGVGTLRRSGTRCDAGALCTWALSPKC